MESKTISNHTVVSPNTIVLSHIPDINYINKLTAERPGWGKTESPSDLETLVKCDIKFLNDCILHDASDGHNYTYTEFLKRTVDHPLYQNYIQKLVEAGYWVKIADIIH